MSSLNSQDAQELPEGVPPGPEKMVALDKSTGATAWETPLQPTRVCYGVPCVTQIDGKYAILCSSTGSGFFALDAENGRPLWDAKPSVFKKRVCSSLVKAGSLLISTEGSVEVAMFCSPSKMMGARNLLYRISRAAPYVPTPVVKDDMMYLWADNGIVSCVATATAKQSGANASEATYRVRL